jgi:hypothetical protein
LDIGVAVLYIAHLAAMIALSVITFRRPKHQASETVEREFRWFIVWAGLSSAAAILISGLAMLASFLGVHAFSHPIHAILLAGASGTLAMAIKYLRTPTSILVGLVGIVCIIFGLVLYFVSMKKVKDELDRVLKASIRIVISRPVSLAINLVIVVIGCVVIGFGLYLIHQILLRFEGWRMVLFAALAAISMVWNARFIGFVGYMTCCGSFASWYFSLDPSQDNRMKHATLKALLRALTRSLGSLALASFLFAVVAVLRLFVGVFCSKCKKGSKKLSEKLDKYVNVYAVVNMALFGLSFLKAAKGASKIIATREKSGEKTLDIYIIIYSIGIGLSSGAVTLGVSGWKYYETDSNGLNRNLFLFLIWLSVTFTSYWISYVALQPMHAALTATFYCACQNRDLIKYSHPIIYNSLKSQIEKPIVAVNTTVAANTTAAANKTKQAATKAKVATAKKAAPAAKKVAPVAKKTVSAATAPVQPVAGAAASQSSMDSV